MNFVDVCDCALFESTDEDGYDLFYVCSECRAWADKQDHLSLAKTEEERDGS
jgi:hypothetical protein